MTKEQFYEALAKLHTLDRHDLSQMEASRRIFVLFEQHLSQSVFLNIVASIHRLNPEPNSTQRMVAEIGKPLHEEYM